MIKYAVFKVFKVENSTSLEVKYLDENFNEIRGYENSNFNVLELSKDIFTRNKQIAKNDRLAKERELFSND